MTLEEALKIATKTTTNGFTQEDIDNRKKLKAICIGNRGCENCLTNGREYELQIGGCISPTHPIADLIGDDGNKIHCHLTRFVKVGEV